MHEIRAWISDNAVAAITLFFAVFVAFLVAPGIWFSQHGGGEYFGAIIGFGALLSGALLNAHLVRQSENENRRAERARDDRLHARELYAATSAIQFELMIAHAGLRKIEAVLPTANLAGVYLVVRQFLPMLDNQIFHRSVEKLMSAFTLTDGAINVNEILSAHSSLQVTRGITTNICDENKPFTFEEITRVRNVTESTIRSVERAIAEIGKILDGVAKQLYSANEMRT